MKKVEILQFKALFPLKAFITQEIIDSADVKDGFNCIGTQILKASLPKKYHKYLNWGDTFTFIHLSEKRVELNDESFFMLATENQLSLMDVTEPTEVVFKIIE